MLDLLHVRKLLDGLIVEASKSIHDLVFLAAGLNADDDLVALFPGLHVFRNHVHRILEICHHLNDTVSGHLQHAVIRRIELSEIAGIEDCLDLRVLRAESAQDRAGVIG